MTKLQKPGPEELKAKYVQQQLFSKFQLHESVHSTALVLNNEVQEQHMLKWCIGDLLQ